jgi:hypothetical protein
MDYLKKELNKLFPLALLFGAIGGVLLIFVANVFEPGKLNLLTSYAAVVGASVYVLNRMRYKKELVGSLLYGFLVYSVMTFIAYIDLLMNANPDYSNPLFEQVGFFVMIFVGTVILSGGIVLLFRKQLIS